MKYIWLPKIIQNQISKEEKLTTSGLFLICLARLAYSRVLRVSSKHWMDGETVAIMHVFVFPPNESLRNLVNLLSLKSRDLFYNGCLCIITSVAMYIMTEQVLYLYGTCPELSTKALMTLPKVSKLLFISPASLALPWILEK